VKAIKRPRPFGISDTPNGISVAIPQIKGQVTIHAAYDVHDKRREGISATAAAVEAGCSSTGDRCSVLSQRPIGNRSFAAEIITSKE